MQASISIKHELNYTEFLNERKMKKVFTEKKERVSEFHEN